MTNSSFTDDHRAATRPAERHPRRASRRASTPSNCRGERDVTAGAGDIAGLSVTVASTGTAAPTAAPMISISSRRLVLPPPATLMAMPGSRSAVAARTVASTTSSTNVKSRTCSPSAEQREGPAGPGGFDEPVNGHVRSLPWSVHREVAQRHCRHTEVRRVGAAQQLRRQLGDAVGVVRLRRVALARRVPVGPAVHRRARGEHEPLARADGGPLRAAVA